MKKIILLCVLVLAGCAPLAQESDETLTIGLLATLSGPAAVHGTHVVIGAEKAVEELNAEGADIKLIVEDNKNQPKEGISGYHRISLEQPDVIFTTMSGASATLLPLAQEDGIPVVTSLTYADFRKYDNVYQYFQTTEDLTSLAANFFTEKGISRVGLLSTNIEAGHALMDIAREKFKDEGLEIVGEEFYAADSVEHRTQILKLADKGPEAIYVFDLRPDKVAKQIKERYDGVVVFSDTPVSTNLFKTIDDLDGVYAAAQLYMIEGTEENEQFQSLFGDVDGNAEAGMGYDVIHLIWEAHQKGELPESVDALETFTGLSGEIDLRESRKPSIPIKMVLIKDKTLVLV